MPRHPAWRRHTVLVAVASLALGQNGCMFYRWRVSPVTEIDLAHEQVQQRQVRATTIKGTVTMKTARVYFPYLEGPVVEDATAPVALKLVSVRRAEIVQVGADFTRSTPVALDPDGLKRLPGHTVRFETATGRVTMRVTQADSQVAVGIPFKSPGYVRLDLRDVTSLSIRELEEFKSTAVTVGLIGGLLGGAYLIVLLTKESCPFVYVDRGHGYELVGEAYAGAAFRSIQRDDLLPLPALPGGTVRVLLRNEARETQYTDEAALVLVHHAPGLRAVSTMDAKIALVGEASPPIEARDGTGAPVAALLARQDERSVETSPELLAQRPHGDHDEIVATFARAEGPSPVLEIVGGNTPWLDLVFGRFFATMGDRLGEYVSSGNEAQAGPGIRAWRRREGVDLSVDVLDQGAWRHVAMVPTVGPIALRWIGVPLPPVDDGSGRTTVRLRSGPGFWRIDQMSLSERASVAARVQRLAPVSATGPQGGGSAAEIAVTDGRVNALPRFADGLELSFALPAVPQGEQRSAFLFTNGYYNVHMPIQARWSPGTLRTISRQPGGLARLSRDMATEYARLSREHPAAEPSGEAAAGGGR